MSKSACRSVSVHVCVYSYGYALCEYIKVISGESMTGDKKIHPFAEPASNMLRVVLLTGMVVKSLFRNRALQVFPYVQAAGTRCVAVRGWVQGLKRHLCMMQELAKQ